MLNFVICLIIISYSCSLSFYSKKSNKLSSLQSKFIKFQSKLNTGIISSLSAQSSTSSSKSSSPPSTNNKVQQQPTEEVEEINYYENAKGFYDSWNNKDIEKAITYFDDNIYFLDGQYKKPFTGKKEVKKYLTDCADSLKNWKFIIDDYILDEKNKKVGLKWHIESTSNIRLPFPTIGLSFLVFNDKGKIINCLDLVEPTIKTGRIQLPLLKVVSKVLRIK
jgi:hypothetical protein